LTSAHSSRRAARSRIGRAKLPLSQSGSVLVAALALAFLVFAITTASLMRVAALAAQVGIRHAQQSALLLAEAGIQKAAYQLVREPGYAGETGTRLPTGSFDVKVQRQGNRFLVTSTGRADSPFKNKPRKTLRASIRIVGPKGFQVLDWRENG